MSANSEAEFQNAGQRINRIQDQCKHRRDSEGYMQDRIPGTDTNSKRAGVTVYPVGAKPSERWRHHRPLQNQPSLQTHTSTLNQGTVGINNNAGKLSSIVVR